jgi:hypothetical protein
MKENEWESEEDEQSRRDVKITKRKITWVFITLLFFCFICFVVMPVYFSIELAKDTLCGNQVIEQQKNNIDSYDYVIFKRDCGATTEFSYQLSIIKHRGNLGNDSGNIYIHDNPFTAEWINKNTLRINGTTINGYKSVKQYKEIKIIYMSE